MVCAFAFFVVCEILSTLAYGKKDQRAATNPFASSSINKYRERKKGPTTNNNNTITNSTKDQQEDHVR